MLRIGVCGPANPYEFKKYLDGSEEIPNINYQAASVNAHIQSLLDEGCEVIVFTKQNTDHKGVFHLHGQRLHFYIASVKDNRKENIFRINTIDLLKRLIRSHLKDIDILHAQWTYEYAYACRSFSDKVPTFCTVRDWCPYQRQIAKRPMERCVWLVNNILFKNVISNSNIHFIANSEYTYKSLIEYGIKNDICKINNGIKSQFIIKERTYYPSTPTFISIAQDLSERRKNIITLLKAFQLLCKEIKAKLILVGNCNQADIETWEKAGLLQQVSFKGAMSHDKVIQLLDSCSSLVHPSIEETFGNILIEGMARRIPVIGGEHSGAVPNVLGNGRYGILCDILDAQEIRNAMKMTVNTNTMKEIINRATEYITQNFSSDIIGKKHLALYQKYLKNESKDI